MLLSSVKSAIVWSHVVSHIGLLERRAKNKFGGRQTCPEMPVGKLYNTSISGAYRLIVSVFPLSAMCLLQTGEL